MSQTSLRGSQTNIKASRSLQSAIKAGDKKTISMPTGGARPAAGAGGAAAAEAAPEEVKKEEEEDVDMGGLFGDDDEYS